MKSFTAKEFSRCPAKVYEAAREYGEVEITHDRFEGKFMLTKINAQRYEYDKLSEIHERNLNSHLDQFLALKKGHTSIIDYQLASAGDELNRSLSINNLINKKAPD